MSYIDPKPVFKSIDKTDQNLLNDGTTFDQAGYSFDQVGWQFGGLYGGDGKKVVLSSISDVKPTMKG